MRSIILPLAFALVVPALGCEKKAVEQPAAPATAASPIGEIKGKQIAIAAGADGFKPNEVKIAKGEEATLVFTRTTNDTCATEVEFPEIKVKKDLPLNKPVAIVVPSGEARTLGFQCGMGMFKSKVIIQ